MASLSSLGKRWPTLLRGETLEAHPSSSHHCQVANLEASLILLLCILILILILLHSHPSLILPPGLQVSMCSLFSCILTAPQASTAPSHSSPKEPPSRKSYSINPVSQYYTRGRFQVHQRSTINIGPSPPRLPSACPSALRGRRLGGCRSPGPTPPPHY